MFCKRIFEKRFTKKRKYVTIPACGIVGVKYLCHPNRMDIGKQMVFRCRYICKPTEEESIFVHRATEKSPPAERDVQGTNRTWLRRGAAEGSRRCRMRSAVAPGRRVGSDRAACYSGWVWELWFAADWYIGLWCGRGQKYPKRFRLRGGNEQKW